MNLFEEVNSLLDTEQDKVAREHYAELVKLQVENYNFYEANEASFTNIHDKWSKYLNKLQKNLDKNSKNIDNFRKGYEFGSLISQKEKFRLLSIDQFYKGQGKLPKWFDEYKMEQLEKAREYVNAFALRSYRNRVNETVMAERKRLEKKIEQLIQEVSSSYQINNKLDPPIIKIQELQHLIEELQEYDRIIPELVIVIMHKTDEACATVVRNFVDFYGRCDQLFK